MPVLLAPDITALAWLPERLGSCTLTCCHAIPGHARPEADVISAWAAALGTDLLTAVAGGPPCERVLNHIAETGELVLYVFWSEPVTRAQVMRAAEALRPYLTA